MFLDLTPCRFSYIPDHSDVYVGYLYLDQNQLTGPLPESLMKSTELETLAVSQNQITGTVPESISQLNELEMLRLNNNNLQGTLPRGLFSLTRLTDLKLDNNDFEGSLSTSIGDLGDLSKCSPRMHQQVCCINLPLTSCR